MLKLSHLLQNVPQPRRRSSLGNALMEYAVPMVLILVTGGVAASVTNMNGLLAEYFLAGSGRIKSAVNGSALETTALDTPPSTALGNGSASFPGLGSSPPAISAASGEYLF